MLKDIFDLHQDGNLDEAERRYREWLAEHPADADALHLLAITRRQRGDLAESIELARRAVELAPDRGNIHLTLASFLLHARQFAEARAEFTTALRLEPNAVGAALGIAQIATMQGDLGAAAEALGKAERMVPNHPQLLSQKAALAQAHGDSRLALNLSIEAAKREPNDPAIQLRVARGFEAQGQVTFAEQAYRNALQLKPTMESARIALAHLLLGDNRPGEALVEFDAVLATQPGHPLALAGRGHVRRAGGDLAAALADYRAAHAAAPAVAPITLALVQALDEAGDHEDARQLLAEALERQPAQADLRRQHVTFATQAGVDDYIAACRAWLAADGARMEPRERLATALELSARHDEADAVARETLAIDSRASFARLILARSALRGGHPAEAQDQLNLVADSALTPAGRADRAVLRGLARDGLADHDGAVQVWLAGQAAQQGLATLTDFPAVDALLATLPAGRDASPGDGQTPLFLVGLPGAGTETVAGWLRQAGYHVPNDRFGRSQRSDSIASGEFASMVKQLGTDQGDAAVDRFRQRYLAALPDAARATPDAFVDWLPFVDLRAVAMLQAAFPDARYLIVERDLRDTLLNWLALGCAQALVFENPERAGGWMASAAAHLDAAKQRLGDDAVRVVRPADVLAPARLLAAIETLTGRPRPASDNARDEPLTGRGGLPTTLPDGRWQAYAKPLGAAFGRVG